MVGSKSRTALSESALEDKMRLWRCISLSMAVKMLQAPVDGTIGKYDFAFLTLLEWLYISEDCEFLSSHLESVEVACLDSHGLN